MSVFNFPLVSLLLLRVIVQCSSKIVFSESFDDATSFENRWIQSKHRQDYGVFKLSSGDFYGDKKENQGIQTSQDSKNYAISTKFEPFSNRDSPLVIQYTIKMNNFIDCGGMYIKLLDCSVNPKDFNRNSSYLIMFGPDKCGRRKAILHAIINYKGRAVPRTDVIQHNPDALTHLYTFIINPDNTYEILVDNIRVFEGNLEDHWKLLPPKKIKDPSKKKPKYWDERMTVIDPNDIKPKDWDQPKYIVDPNSTKPSDWDDKMDGNWEPKKIRNPTYKGKWKPKRIANPKYRGKWIHPQIDNPAYRPDPRLYLQKDICGVGFDLWQVEAGTVFDNILITDDKDFARQEGERKWRTYIQAEMEMQVKVDDEQRMRSLNEENDKEKENGEEVKDEEVGDEAEVIAEDGYEAHTDKILQTESENFDKGDKSPTKREESSESDGQRKDRVNNDQAKKQRQEL